MREVLILWCKQLIDLSDLTLAARECFRTLSFVLLTVSPLAQAQALSSSLPKITM